LSLLLFSAFFGWQSRAEALGPGYARAFHWELKCIIELKPKYLWGGSTDEKKGLDCSGYVFLAAKRAGMPVRRTTSDRMAEGECGWEGVRVFRDEVRHLDLVFWTMKEKRPNGHVGVFYLDADHVTHASSKHNRVVVVPVQGILETAITGCSRLSIGDD
jgi:hypothetical protein